jgi:serine/threonine-protein kinase
MKVEDARQRLGSSGLKVEIGKAVFDEKTPKDRVAQVNPAPGERVAEGDTVTLIPSKGRQPILVPDVRNKSLDDAKQTLRDKGFTLGDETTEPSQTIAKDRVIRTDPKFGEKQSPDQPVGIVVSAGMSMPDLTGRDGDQAANLLRSMGLDVDVDERDDGGKPRDTVLEQDPQPGSSVSRGDRVRIVVNKKDCSVFGINNPFCDQNDGNQNGGQNQDQIQVPGTLGRPVSEAVAILQNAGFQVNVQRRFGTGRVVGQNPLTGTAPRNSVITIFQ